MQDIDQQLVKLFDLDNTLYTAVRNPTGMGHSIHEDLTTEAIHIALAALLPKDLDRDFKNFSDKFQYALREGEKSFKEYGQSLISFAQNYNIPVDEIDAKVCDIFDSAKLYKKFEEAIDPRIADSISLLGGRKIVFTDNLHQHAENILSHLGMEGMFEGIHATNDRVITAPNGSKRIITKKTFEADLPTAIQLLRKEYDLQGSKAIFFDDSTSALKTAAKSDLANGEHLHPSLVRAGRNYTNPERILLYDSGIRSINIDTPKAVTRAYEHIAEYGDLSYNSSRKLPVPINSDAPFEITA